MSNNISLSSLFEDIADAIREKTGSSAQIVADDFPAAIGAIPAGVTFAPTKTASGSAAATLSFSGLLEEPAFFLIVASDCGAISDTHTVAFVLYDGTNFTGGTIWYRSDVASWGNPTFSKAWNNNTKTLTVTANSSREFGKAAVTYTLLYAY